MSNRNNENSRIDHDRLFKELLQEFFEEFVVLFFPKVYEAIDFTHVSFLDKELINDTGARENREIDIVIETRLKEENCLIIVHVEAQASYQKDFNQRMFVYFNRLFEKYRKRILPVALFSYDEKRTESDTLEMSFPFLDVLRFQYLTIELNRLNWRDFIRQDNPVAGALLSKMGYTKEEKVEVKKEFLRMLVRLELDPARNHLLTTFFETYLTLSDDAERTLETEIHKLNPNEEGKVMELMTSYERKGMKKGKQEAICRILNMKFGSSSSFLQQKIHSIGDTQLLDELLEKIFASDSLDHAEKVVEQAT